MSDAAAIAERQARPLLDLGLRLGEGTGAALAWPMVRCAAALLTDVTDGEDPGPSRPGELYEPAVTPPAAGSPFGDALY